jgi:ligand-binding sensor domain-containing protein
MGRASRTRLVATVGVVVALGALLVTGRLTGRALERPGGPAAAVTVGRASPELPLVGKLALGYPVDGVAVADDGGVWIVHHRRLSRVDPWTLRITASVEERRSVTAAAAGAGAVWASAGGELLRVDLRTAQVTARLPVPIGTAAIAAPGVAAGVWAVCCGTDRGLGHARLTRVDPESNRVVATIPLPGPADAVGAGLAGVWVRSPGGPIWRVDPARNRVAATIRVPGGLGATVGSVLVAGGMVLVTDPDNGAVHHLGGDRLTEDAFEADGRDVVVDERGVIWAYSDQRLVGFDPGHTRGRSLEEAGGAIRALAAGHDALWVGAPSGLLRVDFRAMP